MIVGKDNGCYKSCGLFKYLAKVKIARSFGKILIVRLFYIGYSVGR